MTLTSVWSICKSKQLLCNFRHSLTLSTYPCRAYITSGRGDMTRGISREGWPQGRSNLGLILFKYNMTRKLGFLRFTKATNYNLKGFEAFQPQWVRVRRRSHKGHSYQFRQMKYQKVTGLLGQLNLSGQAEVKMCSVALTEG